MSFTLIQQLRLAHALSESAFTIVIPKSESSKFTLLKEKFGMQVLVGASGDVQISKYIRMSHDEPSTSIGELNRPLIFPHSITKYCRTQWRSNREHRYSFAGLVTPNRKELIGNWIKSNITTRTIRLPSQTSLISKLKRRLFSLTGHDETQRKQVGSLMFWSSTRGRSFPIKSWDDDYFDVLSNSQFVLCPSGDYVWSYRFFESILCGAIPIVEKGCNAYQGFRFLNFQDKVKDARWSEEDAEHNYNLCVEKITLPEDQLNEELARLANLDKAANSGIYPETP